MILYTVDCQVNIRQHANYCYFFTNTCHGLRLENIWCIREWNMKYEINIDWWKERKFFRKKKRRGFFFISFSHFM